MSINYPTNLDTFTDPNGNDFLNSPDHAVQHSNANNAIEALESKVGIGSSTATDNTVLKGTGAGVTEYAQVATDDIADNAITTGKIANDNITSQKIANDNITSQKIALVSDYVDFQDLDQTHATTTDIAGATLTLTAVTDGVMWIGFGGYLGGQADANGDLTVAFTLVLNDAVFPIGDASGFIPYLDKRNETANTQIRLPAGFFVPVNVSAGANTIKLKGWILNGTNFDISGRLSAFLTSTQIT